MAKKYEINLTVTEGQSNALKKLLNSLPPSQIRDLGLTPEETTRALDALYFFEKQLHEILP